MAKIKAPKVKLQCTLSDGAIATRVTDHAYTHAVICTKTNAQDATQHAVGVWRWTSRLELAQDYQRRMQALADGGKLPLMAGLQFSIVSVEKSQ